MSTSSSPSRRHAPAAVRRAQILDAALRCFAARGYHAATMDAVAAEAGLSKGSLYWHFRGKQEILLALFDRVTEETLVELQALRTAPGPVLETLRQALAGYLARIGALGPPVIRATVEFLAHPEVRARLGQAWRESRAVLAEALRRGAARGEVGAHVDPDAVAAGMVACAEGFVLGCAADDDFDPGAYWPATWDALARGLAP
jgi:AcrR family transcriptional regulator